jgi:site-specific DNA recombinase
MRVRAYLRRSHERERGVSLDVQRETMRTDVARRGWALDTVEYLDDDRSAFRDDLDNRPAMRAALEDARRRQFDVLIVYKFDRLARDESVYFGLLNDFRKLRVKVISATESDDPLARALSGVLAAEYSRILSKRMIDVRRWEALQGKLVGPAPRGYDRGPDGIPIKNADAPMMLELGERYATGDWSPERLARHYGLNVHAVREMLECQVYSGRIVCSGEVFPGKHEPIWPPELWAKIETVRQSRSRRRTSPPKTHDPLLASLIYCASCGAPLWHQFTHNRRYYECSTRRTAKPGPYPHDLACQTQRAHAEAVEGAILSLLGGLTSIPDLIHDVRQALRVSVPKVTPSPRAALDMLKARFLREEISALEFERLKAAALQAPAPAPEPFNTGAALALLNDLPALLRAATPSEVRPVLRELITEVYARRTEVIGVRPTVLGAALLGEAAAQPEEWLNQSAAWWAGREGSLNIRTPVLLRPPALLEVL